MTYPQGRDTKFGRMEMERKKRVKWTLLFGYPSGLHSRWFCALKKINQGEVAKMSRGAEVDFPYSYDAFR